MRVFLWLFKQTQLFGFWILLLTYDTSISTPTTLSTFNNNNTHHTCHIYNQDIIRYLSSNITSKMYKIAFDEFAVQRENTFRLNSTEVQPIQKKRLGRRWRPLLIMSSSIHGICFSYTKFLDMFFKAHIKY